MGLKMLSALAGALLAANAVTATSFEYYRGAFCDAQSSDFFIERYESPLALKNDKLCHQTPAGTMAMKLKDGLPEGCVGKCSGLQAVRNRITDFQSAGI